jgi:hypothetical protein
VAKRPLYLGMPAWRQLANPLGQGGTGNGPYVVAIGHTFGRESLAAAERNFDRQCGEWWM